MRLLLTCVFLPTALWAVGGPRYVETSPRPGAFALVQNGAAAAVEVDAADWPGVQRAAHDLQADINRVTGVTPAWNTTARKMILIGTAGKSPLIDRLASAGKIDVNGLRGKWESFFLQTVSNPLPGVDSALVIAGSDKRGTIYGIYDLSEQIGVSPWYWWADVTPEHHSALYIMRRQISAGRAQRQIPRHLSQRRKARPGFLGTGQIRRARRSRRRGGELQQRLLHQSLRSDSANEGQLSLAGHVEQCLR